MNHTPQPAASPGALERFVGSFAFSVVCCLIWAAVAAPRVRAFARDPGPMELLWLVYNSLLCLLFLVRTRPRAVSMDPVHWLVALVTSFAGFFFENRSAGPALLALAGDGAILIGLLGCLASAFALRRSYDFLPALRGVSTGWVYGLVRHPMYASSMLIRLGYLARHPSVQNAALLWLYHRRAVFEERIMMGDERYAEYARRVCWRFVPGIV